MREKYSHLDDAHSPRITLRRTCLKYCLMLLLIIFISFWVNYFLYAYHGGNSRKDLSNENAKHDKSGDLKLAMVSSGFYEHPRFVRHSQVENIDCQRIYDGDQAYIRSIPKTVRALHPAPLNMSCEAIRSRVIGNFPNPNVNYPIAIARNVFKDYEFLELQLSVSYSSENHFCFSVDAKSPPKFHHQMKMLATCLPNVYISREKRLIDSAGHNMNRAHMDCVKPLLMKGDWNYVILLQNYDAVLHTNTELAAIFKSLNGANLIKTVNLIGGRINKTLPWDPKDMRMFKNISPLNKEERQTAKLEFSSGYAQSCLTREAVHWMVNQMNMTKMIDQFNSNSYGVDEQWLSTLQNSETLKMPGGYHSACLKKNKTVDDITRFCKWQGGGECNSEHYRHGLCVFGIEDLVLLEKEASPRFISVNKMMQEVDFAAVSCMAERLFNRTHHQQSLLFDKTYFANLPLVNYQTIKAQPNFDPTDYKC